ncbi:MAG: response regulator receiver [Frankiales bacterium]|nr:response regulator receiver [Frankiales bacterium]
MTPLPRLLLVDDEPNVLHALRRTLRGAAEVQLCTDPLEALTWLGQAVAEEVPPAAVVCDMRMPGLDGAQTLARARELSPDTTRLLLTGQTDLEAAVRAVNDGGIFRFLTKPCAPEQLLAAVGDAVEQHRLRTAERVLLEQTLKGAVTALLDTLGLADPQVFSRALRVKRLVARIARTAEVRLTWDLEIAVMLAHLGLVSLPRTVLDKLDRGRALTEAETASVARVPTVSARLLAGIPRLEPVHEAVACSRLRYDGRGSPVGSPLHDGLPLASRLLRLATDLDSALTSGLAEAEALTLLRSDAGAYDPALLEAAGKGGREGSRDLRLVRVAELQRTMTIASDVVSASGALLLGRGSAVTAGVVERLRAHEDNGSLTGRILVETAGPEPALPRAG